MSYIPDRKIMELTHKINEAREKFEQAVAERDQLRADLAAARAECESAWILRDAVAKDARRYVWLRDIFYRNPSYTLPVSKTPDQFDAAIDAAIAGEKK